MLKRPFTPEVKKTTYRGSVVYQIDCREWKEQMQALEYPLRRRFPSWQQAREWRDRLVVDAQVGRQRDPGPLPIQSLSELYLRSIDASAKSKATADTYRSLQGKFVAFLHAHDIQDVRQVTTVTVEMYRVEMFGEGLSPYGVRAAIQSVVALFSWANSMGYVDGNPAHGLAPATPKSERRAFTESERRMLLRDSSPELRPAWMLLMLTGLRRSELVGLRIEDAVLQSPAPFLRIVGKGDKVRTVPLTPEAQGAVRALVDTPRRPWREGFVLPWSYQRIYHQWIAERDRLELPADLKLHSFRHTFLSWLANRTGTPLTEVQAVAGHSSVVQTEVYVHRDESMLRAGMARLEADMASAWHSDEDALEETQQQSGVADARS